MEARTIHSRSAPLDATVRATPSKSVTHRALVAAALADGESRVLDPLEADDTRITRDGLAAMGIAVCEEPGSWVVRGGAGHVPGGGRLELGASGTSLRFLLAVAALGQRSSRLDGVPRLRERPVGELAVALRQLGASLRLDGAAGGLPLAAGGAPLAGGKVELAAAESSQYASALLLIGPALPGGLELRLEPSAVSLPYVQLTVDVMRAFGAVVEQPEPLVWCVEPGTTHGTRYRVEGDHSSASYFLAAAAIAGGRVRVDGLGPASAQPDSRLASLLERLGCRVESGPDWIAVEGSGTIPAFDLEMGEAPDLVPTLAALALFADGPCALRGIAHLRLKESDRTAVLADNLTRLGREARAEADRLVIGPPGASRRATIATESDHRMAMAFAVAGLRTPGVVIDDPACVVKSNPRFWEQFAALEGP